MNDPYPVYARLRNTDPVLVSPQLGLTLFSRYTDVQALLRDPRLGRAPVDDATITHQQTPHYHRYVSDNLLEREGETHTRLRCIFAQLLTPGVINSLQAAISRKCATLVAAALAQKSFDFLEAVAVPLTVDVIAELMGWPEAKRHLLRPWSARIVRLYEKDCTTDHEMAAEQATTEFSECLHRLADQRLVQPGIDLISQLAAMEKLGRLSRDELISSCMLLLNAGHEATVNAAGNGLLALLRHPEQLAKLRASLPPAADTGADAPGASGDSAGDSAGSAGPTLLPGAIEEMLRYDPPLHFFDRFVGEDLEFRGARLRRGDKVGLLYGAANRDPEAFRNPDTFDIRRRPNRHLAFGGETHFCMGAPLARLELTILFRTLLTQAPALHLTQLNPQYRAGFVFRGLEQLLVSGTR